MALIPRGHRTVRWLGAMVGAALAVFHPTPVTAQIHSVTSLTGPEIARLDPRSSGDQGRGVASALPPLPHSGPPPGNVR
jgi:hypothetical protein